MILLFVLFPRISGPIWGLPQDAHIAKTGISNTMTLGKISELIKSDAVAFRVKFDGEIPANNALYWRGPVLWQTDGTQWHELTLSQQARHSPPVITASNEAVKYTVTLEPHNAHWLFALDLPNLFSKDLTTRLSHDATLLSDNPVKSRVQYKLSSSTDFVMDADNDPHVKAALVLPNVLHPRTRALAEQWLQNANSAESLIQMALNHFNQAPFYYTLTPPALSCDVVDRFLFESRQGFC